MSMSKAVTSRHYQSLPVVGADDLHGIYTFDEIEELKKSVPVFTSFGSQAIRVAEIDRIDITEDANAATRLYDCFDIFMQASNHIFAAVSALKLVGLTVSDLPDDVQPLVNEIEPSKSDVTRLRKAVIERIFEETAAHPELMPKKEGDLS